MSSRVSSSRLPVGSSARTTLGCLTSARRDGHPLLLPAGQLEGQVGGTVGESTSSRAASACRRRSRPRRCSGNEGHLDVLERRQGGDEVERLEHETERLRTQVGQL